MVTVIFHEVIVHAVKTSGVSDRTFTSNSKVMNDLKASILEYAKLTNINLSDKQAAALAFVGGNIDVNSDFFKENGFKDAAEVISIYQSLMVKPGCDTENTDERQAAKSVSDKDEKPMDDIQTCD